jgi:hypothetical protein
MIKTMKTHKFELTDNLIGINGLGTYHGYFNPECIIDNYIISQDIEEGYLPRDWTVYTYWEKFNYDLYTDKLVKIVDNQAQNLAWELNYLLNKYHSRYEDNTQINPIESIGCVGINSPKYYNYRDDWFLLDFNVNYGAFKESVWNCVNENPEFLTFLKANYTSCDGFLSHTANNYSDWEKGFKEDREQEIGAALSFIINNLLDYDFVNDCLENSEIYYMDFIEE